MLPCMFMEMVYHASPELPKFADPFFSWDLPLAKPEVSLWVSAASCTKERLGNLDQQTASLK